MLLSEIIANEERGKGHAAGARRSELRRSALGARRSALGSGGRRKISGCREDVPQAEGFLSPPQPRAESRRSESPQPGAVLQSAARLTRILAPPSGSRASP